MKELKIIKQYLLSKDQEMRSLGMNLLLQDNDFKNHRSLIYGFRNEEILNFYLEAIFTFHLEQLALENAFMPIVYNIIDDYVYYHTHKYPIVYQRRSIVHKLISMHTRLHDDWFQVHRYSFEPQFTSLSVAILCYIFTKTKFYRKHYRHKVICDKIYTLEDSAQMITIGLGTLQHFIVPTDIFISNLKTLCQFKKY